MKLTIAEILNLEIELLGFKNNENNIEIKGLLNESLNLKTKYWLNKLLSKIESEKKAFNDSRNAFIKELGEEQSDGNLIIPMTIKEKGKEITNPNYEKFNIQVNELLKQEIEFDKISFKIDDFDFVSNSNYSLFMNKCIIEE
jgi:hypothetical protein